MKNRLVVFGIALMLSACNKCSGPSEKAEKVVSENLWEREDVKAAIAAGGFHKITLSDGGGEAAVSGKPTTVHYTGWLTDGTQFDSSRERGEPFTFPLGDGRVIKGWDEGVLGMLPKERVLLVIPPEMGYGDRGAGGVIPPGATLLFDVEFIEQG